MKNELKDCSTKLKENELKDCPTKLLEKHVAGLSRRREVKNEQRDSHVLVEIAVAGRRIAGNWCGVERSRMVDGYVGCDGYNGNDGVDGVDGFDGSDGVDGSFGHQIERTGVDDVLGYDYPGKMAVPLDDFCPKLNFGSERSRSSRRVSKAGGPSVASVASMASMT